MAVNNAKILSVTSTKGGVGKTIFAYTLAQNYAKTKKTLLIDLDLYTGVLDTLSNLEGEVSLYNLVDDMMNNRYTEIQNYTRKYNDNMDILTSPLDPRSSSIIKSNYINLLLKRVRLQYDIIIIDTNQQMSAINSIAFDQSNYILYIMNKDLLNIKTMKTMINILNDMEIKNYKIILNNYGNNDYSKEDTEAILQTKIDYVLDKKYFIKNIDEEIFKGNLKITSKTIDKIIKEL